MNFNQWDAKEEPDVLSELDKLDKYRATFYERSKGIKQSKYDAKLRREVTQQYCYSQMKTYEELIKMK